MSNNPITPNASRDPEPEPDKKISTNDFLEIYVDRTANRMSLAALGGSVLGLSTATLRGTPIFATTLSTAFSCALAASACLASERLFYTIIPRPSPILKGYEDYLAHACGGALGGSIVGALFSRKPLPGAFLFTPLMLGVAYAERELRQYQMQRLEELIKELESRSK